MLDASGAPWLIRGTQLAQLTTNPADIEGTSTGFGALSPTTLIGIRHRLNMNAVRLPLGAREYVGSASYRASVKRVILNANEFELLVIAEAGSGASQEFWKLFATDYKSNPNLFYAPASGDFVAAIRAAGAAQPVILPDESNNPAPELQTIRQITPHFATIRDTLSSALSGKAPILINDLDPRLNEDSPECSAFPAEPGEATSLVNEYLRYFDIHNISWTLSSFTPPRLITDYRYFNGTKLDNGWTCGKPGPVPVGLGLVILSHLWNATPLGLFSVSATRGGFVLSRGGVATAYGPILADRELGTGIAPHPRTLGNVSVRVTDSRGAARFAPLLHTGAGWTQISFVIPPESATGPAEAAIVRTDGSISRSRIVIADVAPGLWTATADGRGPAMALVTQRLSNGATKTFNSWRCDANGCADVAIGVQPQSDTTLQLIATGFRYAGSHPNVVVTLGDRRLTPIFLAPRITPENDNLTIRIPRDFRATGDIDVWFSVNGITSNVARLKFVAATPTPPVSARATLGRYLFYDKRMSVNGTTSCATCHRQELAFTDGLARARGATGELHPRSAMSLVNLAVSRNYNWSDPTVHTLEQQALKPMLSTTPLELGFGSVKETFLRAACRDKITGPLFRRAFPGVPSPCTTGNIASALAAFERTIVSRDSSYDRYHLNGDDGAISEAAKRGEFLFYLDGGPSCFRCHSGRDFTDTASFHNTGLYNLPGEFSYPAPNLGLYGFTKRPADIGKFKAPTLRNIAVTAPYMHDGSIATLEEVIEHYAAGGRAVAEGALAGAGHDNPAKDKLIHGFPLTPGNRADLVAFLKSLTDETLLRNPAFSNPW